MLMLALGSLSACGGGGDGGGGGASTTVPSAYTVGASTGSVSATYIYSTPTPLSRYVLLGVGSQTIGNITPAPVQEANGSMTTIATNSFSGNKITKEISGDGYFAQGRWADGDVTLGGATTNISGLHNKFYHYLTYTPLTALPASGTATCDSGKFTAPTYAGVGSVGDGHLAPPGINVSGYTGDIATHGVSSGSASITFSGSGANIVGSISTGVIATNQAASSSGNMSFNVTLPTAAASSITGGFFGSGTGALIAIGNGGGSSYIVVAPYAVVLANTVRYTGIATFRCA